MINRSEILSVEDVEAFLVDLPTIRPHRLSMTTMRRQTLVIVKVRCSDGVCGLGKPRRSVASATAREPGRDEACHRHLHRPGAPRLRPVQVATMARIARNVRGNHFAMCAIETALLDASGIRLGLPQAELRSLGTRYQRFELQVRRGPGDDRHGRRWIDTSARLRPCSCATLLGSIASAINQHCNQGRGSMAEDWWVRVASVKDVAEGEVIGVEAEGKEIALYHLEGGEFRATANVCTHEFARLSDGWLEENEIECPLHGGKFDVRTGTALCPPVESVLLVYKVRLSGEDILIKL
jgi:nitrite reductase/ring-hydroxylating ferredoxin subunit